MKKKKFITSKSGIAILAAAAIVLLGISSITGARAALNYRSEVFSGEVQMYDIGVSLWEKSGDGEAAIVAHRDYDSKKDDGSWDKDSPGNLLENLIPEGEYLIPGKPYSEELYVENTGSINEYVRVTLYKYWLNKDESVTDSSTIGYQNAEAVDGAIGDSSRGKAVDLDPALIQLHLVNEDDWIVDSETSGGKERTVLYYKHLLTTDDSKSSLFADQITIDGSIAKKVRETVTESKTEDGQTVKTTQTVYAYDGYTFVLEAMVDAVQEHNAADAMLSSWGKSVTMSGTDIQSLN